MKEYEAGVEAVSTVLAAAIIGELTERIGIRLSPFADALGFRGWVREVIATYDSTPADGNWGGAPWTSYLTRNRHRMVFDVRGFCVYEEMALGFRPKTMMDRVRSGLAAGDFIEDDYKYTINWKLERTPIGPRRYREVKTTLRVGQKKATHARAHDAIHELNDRRMLTSIQPADPTDKPPNFAYTPDGRLQSCRGMSRTGFIRLTLDYREPGVTFAEVESIFGNVVPFLFVAIEENILQVHQESQYSSRMEQSRTLKFNRAGLCIFQSRFRRSEHHISYSLDSKGNWTLANFSEWSGHPSMWWRESPWPIKPIAPALRRFRYWDESDLACDEEGPITPSR